MLDFCCSINVGHQVFDEIFTKNSQDKKLLIAFFGAVYKKKTVFGTFTTRRQFSFYRNTLLKVGFICKIVPC